MKVVLYGAVLPALFAADGAPRNLSAAPKFSLSGVVNGASFVPGISPGSFATIFGENLAPVARSWDGAIQGTALPAQLEGVSVTVGGKPAYLAYISPTQLNVLLPADPMAGSAEVKVTTAEGSAGVAAVIESQAPGFFPSSLDRKYVAARHADSVAVAGVGQSPGIASRPAQPGEEIVLWGTGFGPTAEPVPSGQVLAKVYPLANPAALKVTIGGRDAAVTFAGVTMAGVYQINAVVPPDAVDGDQAVLAEIGGKRTQANVFIPVQRAAQAASILIYFRLDPWLVSNNYGGAVWTAPPLGPATQGAATFAVEARAQGLDPQGQPIDISPQWIASDPGMVSVSPNPGNQVAITVQRAGQSRLRVISTGVSKELIVTAANQGNVLQVQIAQ